MTSFAITFDYRCPFARNANEAVIAGLGAGASWEVTWVPFCLGQVHVEEGEPDVWDRPEEDSGLLALQVAVTVRDRSPEAFPGLHGDLFALRHDEARDLRDRDALGEVLDRHGIASGPVWGAIDDGSALATVRDEHLAAAKDHDVWGVPTFIVGDHAAFARLMDRPDGAADPGSITEIDRVLDLVVGVPNLNELKHTSLPH